MASTLIVPIDVAALAVGEPDTSAGVSALVPMADFSKLAPPDAPYLSTTVLANAVAFEGSAALLQGIHLHWALPDGLTGGQPGDSALAFPAVPERWLVTRIVVSTASGAPATTTLRSWVVESDRLNPAGLSVPDGFYWPTVPSTATMPPPSGPASYSYLGQSFDLATWQEVGAAASRLTPQLTAMGFGETTFAAFYPNCSTVFGFYDALTDLTDYDPTASTISYHVAGWYSTPAIDPLTQPNAVPATYDWSCPAGATPTATVCTGMVDPIAWNPATAYLADDAPAKLNVGVASSPPEAISALIRHVLHEQDPDKFTNAEPVLNALQLGLFAGAISEPDAIERFEEALHSAGFARSSAGPLWSVVAASGTTDGEGQPVGEGGEVTLPDDLGDALNALNAQQLQLNDAQAQLAGLQLQLFVDWAKFVLVEQLASGVPSALLDNSDDVMQYLNDEVLAIQALDGPQGTIATLQSAVAGAVATLGEQLDASLTLTSTGAPRYYQAADPFLVLEGDDVTPADRYGNDGANSSDGTLPCRLDSDVVGGAQLAAGLVAGSADTSVAATALPPLAALPADAPAELLQALVWEAFFLAVGLAPSLAAAVAAAGGDANPAVLDLDGTVAALQAAAKAFLAGTPPAGVTYAGSAPDAIYYDSWSTPWLPFLLQYDVQLAPVQYLDFSDGRESYPATFIADNFTFDDDSIDLQYGGDAPATLQTYTGTVILTPNATIDLANAVAAALDATNADPALASVLAGLDDAPLLAQGLTGFTEALLMRSLTLQMPVADPWLAQTYKGFVSSVAAAVGGQTTTAPLPDNSFNPIRAGLFTINKLRLVDVFGRFKDYPSPPVAVAQGLAPPPQLGAGGGQAFLPPRITQPARLLFRWRAADNASIESNAAPATTPVLGWVVPNYLDNGLALYANSGTPLGELALSGDGDTVLWTPTPGGQNALDTPLATVLAGQNADLVAFAEGIYNGGDPSFFAPFFSAVRAALTFSLPARFRENAAQAVLFGQPLALARASLALDVAGPIATDESWTTFTNAVLDEPPPPPSDGGLSTVQFPVRLGALNRLDDTLVGYWIAPSDAAGYRTFYAPAAATAEGGVAPPAQDTLTLTPIGSSAGQTDVVVLFDPRGTVHATTGILPVKEIGIPPDQYTSTLASLGVTFAAAPILSGSNVPAPAAGAAPPMVMVQPSVPAGTWSWVTVAAAQWASTTLVDAATAQATLNETPQQISEGWLGLTGLQPSP